jgi:hypothetical protein
MFTRLVTEDGFQNISHSTGHQLMYTKDNFRSVGIADLMELVDTGMRSQLHTWWKLNALFPEQ